jgi:hypothetical protein
VIDYRYPEEYKVCQAKECSRYDYALVKIEGKVPKDSYIELVLNYVQKPKEEIGIVGYRGASCSHS